MASTCPARRLPQGNSIKNTVNKMNAQQPVTIVVMGASISWGLQTAKSGAGSLAGKNWKACFGINFGYSGITVVNAAVPGFQFRLKERARRARSSLAGNP